MVKESIPKVNLAGLEPFALSLRDMPPGLRELCELDIKYEGYIKRQQREVEHVKKMDDLRIPPDFDWDGAEGVSREARQKLKAVRPLSLGQASRVAGVRPSDIAVLTLLVRKKKEA